MNRVEFYLEDLKSKFAKINPNEYYLAYSGGRDSHFLLWFIREYLHEDRITPVFENTGMEIPEIRDRALANAQVILKPALKHAEIKEKYGIPLNTKASDNWVYRYQLLKSKGYSDEEMPDYIRYYVLREIGEYAKIHKNGLISFMAVNKKTSEALQNGTLHKVSNYCCEFLKKKPAKLWQERERERGNTRKAIVGIMGSESFRRKNMLNKSQGCFNQQGVFMPIHDLTEDLRNEIEEYCGIPVPSVYSWVTQTGCAGCPYGQHGKNKFFNTNFDLSLCGDGQRKFIMDYFKESYDFKGYKYTPMIFGMKG